MSKDQEIKLNKQEDQENKETQQSSVSLDQERNKRAIALGAEVMGEPGVAMAGFVVISYLKEFYPELKPDLAIRIMEIVKSNERDVSGVTTTDIKGIKEDLEKNSIHLGEKALESLENCVILDFMLRKALPLILEAKPEDHLKILDVGGGPTIYQHIALMGIADSIVHAEFLSENREEVEKWKQGKSEFVWSSFLETFTSYLKEHPEISAGEKTAEDVKDRFAKMSASSAQELEDILRDKVKEVISCDVFREDLGMGEDRVNSDLLNFGREGYGQLITSNFCIESATADRGLWEKGIKNVSKKVSENGFLMMTAIRNAKWYKVGYEKMDAVPISAHDLYAELEKNGFDIVTSSELVGSNQEEVGYDGMVFVLARKKTVEEIALE